MTDYGLTKLGFKRKPYTAILEDKRARARSFFGEDVNLSDRSPLGLFIQTIAWEESRLWEVAEDVYYSAYIDDAEGKQLDGVVKYATSGRKGAQKSRTFIIANGDEGTEITPENLIVGTKAEINFKPTETKTIDIEPTTIEVECMMPGEVGNVPASSITEIITPIIGLDSVTNPEQAEGGQGIEEDAELRDRYYRSLSRGGSSSRLAVEAALLDMEAVKDAVVEKNETIEVVNGIPPKCIAPYVFGGDDIEIAKTILQKKAGGIQSFGDIQIEVEDSKGYKHTIGFSRPASKYIYVKITVTRNAQYPADGDVQIRTAVIKYIGGQDEDGTEHKGLGLGQDVVLSKIISVANISGVEDVIVELSTDGQTYASANIPISKMEIATTDYVKVAVV